MEKTESSATKMEHEQLEPPVTATGCGSSSREPTAGIPDGIYIEGFEKDLERCLEKTAALRALADVEPIEAPARAQRPRHPNPQCYCPWPNCPALGDVEEQCDVNERSSPSPAHDDEQSALEAPQSESAQVDPELVPERPSHHVFVVPMVGDLPVSEKVTPVVVDDPVKALPDAKLSFLKLFAFADTIDYFLMFLGSLGACAHGVAVPVFFVFFGRLINAFGFNQHHPHRLAQEVGKEALSMFYLGLVVMFASWMEVACWMQTGERQSARMRVRYLQSVLSQDVGYFDTNVNTAEIVGHIAQNISLVQDAISEKTGNCIHFMAKFVAGFAVGFSAVWQLSLTTLAVVPAIVVAGSAYAVTMTGHATKSQKAYEDAGRTAEQVITQVRTVYAYVGEASAVNAYSKQLQTTLKLGKQGGLAKGLGLGFTYALCVGAWALLLWYAGKLVRHGHTNGGKAFTTILNVVVGGMYALYHRHHLSM